MSNDWKPYLEYAGWDTYFIQNLENTKISGHLRSILESIPSLYKRMEKDGILDYFPGTLEDIQFRMKRYHEKFDVFGLSAHDMKWVKPIFDYNFFQIGPLRYQYFIMDYKALERSGRDYLELTERFKSRHKIGNHYIMIHIPRGASLEMKAVKRSLIEAHILMCHLHPKIKFEGFIIRAWLMHPSIDILLPETSKIRQFKQCFEIVGDAPITYQMLNRVFGTDNLDEINQFVPKTSLQTAVKNHIHEIGVGIGFKSIETLLQVEYNE